MRRSIGLFLVLIFVTLLADVLLRIFNPTPTAIVFVSDISIIDLILAVEFGIPVAMEIYSSFFLRERNDRNLASQRSATNPIAISV